MFRFLLTHEHGVPHTGRSLSDSLQEEALDQKNFILYTIC